jgi:hypothetical protein
MIGLGLAGTNRQPGCYQYSNWGDAEAARAGGSERSWQWWHSGSGRLCGFGSSSWRLCRRGSGSGSMNVAVSAAGSGGSWRWRRSISRGMRRSCSGSWDLVERAAGSGGSCRQRRSISDSGRLPGRSSGSMGPQCKLHPRDLEAN